MSSEYRPLRSWTFGALQIVETNIPDMVEFVIQHEKKAEDDDSYVVGLCALLTKEQFKALARLAEYQSMYSDCVRYVEAPEPEPEQEAPE